MGAAAPAQPMLLAEARLPLKGPAAALEALHSAIEFAEAIGDVSNGQGARSSTLYPLFDLGE